MRLTLTLLALAGCLLVPAISLAQQTGSVSGAIFARSGAPVAGATVKISGDPMPTAREALTTETGSFTFLLLLPGRYKVEVEKAGLGKTSRDVEVALDRNTQSDFILGSVTEQVNVSAALPSVDVKKTELNFNFTADQLQNLPIARNYSALFQLIPGVAENNSFAPNGGGSRQDNKYLLDGVDITNPGFGYLSTEVNGLDVAEFNIKRGAITAEFGRAQGFVTNFVTKSGTNQLRGTSRIEFRPREFSARSVLVNATGDQKLIDNTTDNWNVGVSAGGPVIKSRLFWYGSAQYVDSNTTKRTNSLGAVPDSNTKTKEVFGKATFQASPTMMINGGYRYRPAKCVVCSIGDTEAPTVARDNDTNSRVGTLTWNYFAGQRTVFEAKYIRMEENFRAEAKTDLGFLPAFNVNDLTTMGQITVSNVTRGGHNLRTENQNYKRNEFRATATRFFDFGGSHHQAKAGFNVEQGEEFLQRLSNGWGTLVFVQSNTQVRARYYPVQPAQVSPGRTYALFIQDDITLVRRVVINAGLLANRDEFTNVTAAKNTFLKFDFGDELQPRIGVNYQLREGQGDKIYGNWGRYYAMDQKSSARSLAPARLYLNEALFNAATGALISNSPLASTTGKTIDKGIKPPYMDETVFGYATPLPDGWSLDAFFIYRNSKDFIEDIPASLPAAGPFHAAQLPNAVRKYKSLGVEASRRFGADWSAVLSYAWSKLYGNFDLDYSTGAVFNTSSAIQDGPGEFVEDPLRYGPLTQDRTHVLKMFLTWMPHWAPNLSIGAYERTESGTPWSARARDWDNGSRRYLEQAGANRNPFWTNLDLLAGYGVKFDRTKVRVEGRIQNLFNQRTPLAVDHLKYDDRIQYSTAALIAACGPNLTPTGPTAICATNLMAPGVVPNARFGKPIDFAPPRRFALAVMFDF